MRSLRARAIFWTLAPTVLVLIIVAVIALVTYERAIRGVAVRSLPERRGVEHARSPMDDLFDRVRRSPRSSFSSV